MCVNIISGKWGQAPFILFWGKNGACPYFSAGITGWKRHYKYLPGTPDFVFLGKKVVVFVDGCFWHGCPRCIIYPKSNVRFWRKKISNNRLRDKEVNRRLAARGWKVIRVWEHKIKRSPGVAIRDFKRLTSKRF